MAERTHIFDTQDELDDYLFAFVMAFAGNTGILKADPTEEEEKKINRYLEQLVLNIKAYAQEYNDLFKEGKIDKPFKQDFETYKSHGWNTIEEIRKNTIKLNEETLKYFGIKDDDK